MIIYYVMIILAMNIPVTLNNTAGINPPIDEISPAPVFTPYSAIDSGNAILKWVAPGDDGNEGTAFLYDIRCFYDTLTELTWQHAVVLSPPKPSPSGEIDFIIINIDTLKQHFNSQLLNGRLHFGIKTRDEVENWSSLGVLYPYELGIGPPENVEWK